MLIIGVSEDDNMLILLDDELEDYSEPSHFHSGSINDLLEQLPIKLKVQHINRHVLNVQPLEKIQFTESLDPIGAAESLDPVETAESLDPIQEDMEPLDLIEHVEALDTEVTNK